ncbi:hypothetical protein [Nocardia aurantiaca]|uniref:WXG100 family type VII secretion target n=1 Tax=Nocardia aurantiaca TaxID=2675850 RepID=A0A6I3KTX4_9NOCA|nr:hypothetical protein [Nocardia aurantiaca]MTE11534.1 hypothetical protein [Nocardia aurantiaca]
MSGRLESYRDLLVKASEKTGEVRDGINGVVNTFTAQADSLGTPWGNDSLGNQFANGDQGYLASKKNILEGASNMAGTFANFSQSQKDSADELERTEEANRQGFQQAAQ